MSALFSRKVKLQKVNAQSNRIYSVYWTDYLGIPFVRIAALVS